MIQTLISMMDAAIAAHIPTVKRHGLAELMAIEGGGTQPVVYVDNGSFTQIANDNSGTFSYWRLGTEKNRSTEVQGQCGDAFEVTIPLRFVAMVDRAICPSVQDAARSATWAATATDGAIKSVTNALIVDFASSSIEADTRKVYQQEFGRPLDEASKAFVAIDFSVIVTGNPECFDPCNAVGDFLCLLIQKKQWAQIQNCLTDAQEAAAITALCGAGNLCAEVNAAGPTEVVACVVANGDIPIYLCTILATDEASPDIIVECIGNAGKTAEVQDIICDPCGDVEIIDQNLDIIATPACGTQYSVLVFDGIDGGASNTTYTNSIVAP